MPKCNNTELT